MLAACVGLGMMANLIRFISGQIHPFEIVFFRNLMQLLLMLPWFFRHGPGVMRTTRLPLHMLRSVLGVFGMLCMFMALSLIPASEVTALTFTSPLFATLGAALILGETVRARRWGATAVGFLGALIILRPGMEEFTLATGLALTAAASRAMTALAMKSLSRTDNPNVMVAYMALITTPISLVAALFVWELPSWETLGWLVVLGTTATAVHLSLSRAYGATDASALQSFDFMRLPAAALFAFLIFGEVSDIWVWIGAGVVFCSTLLTTRNEARAAAPKSGPL